jgi:GNAT superfamily N-acetyltransferase
MSYIYKIHHLSTSDPILLAFLAGKFAALRLSALTVSAPAFSSTFETESAFNASHWTKRLQRPLTHFFIAVAYAPNATLQEQQTIDAGDWVGSATLLGPFPKDKFELPESGGPEIDGDDVESKWQMTAVYSSPDHRGKGLAKLLIKDAEGFARREGGEGKRCRVRIMIHPRNVIVKKLYYDLGFVDAGLCTLVEAYISNGDVEMLPPDGGASQPEKYSLRRGLVMNKVSS